MRRAWLYVSTLILVGLWLVSSQAIIGSARLTSTQSVGSNLFATATTFGAANSVNEANSWTTGLSHAAGAGPNRLLMFAVGYEHCSDIGVSAVSYGGRSLSRITGVAADGGCYGRVELWYLKESDIAAASGNTFTVTWGAGGPPAYPMYAAITYKSVDQASPITGSSTNFTDTSTPNPLTTSVSPVAGGMVVSGAISGNNGSYAWNNSFVEGTDQTSGATVTMSTASKQVASAGSQTASATHSGPNRLAIVAAALSPDTVTRIGSWTTGLTHTVTAGTNRLLVFAVGYEECGGATAVNTVSYGGQALTRISGTEASSGCEDGVELWYLKESGIQAASGNTFSVTWSGLTATDPLYAAVTYAYVDQTTPVNNSATNFTNSSTPNPITITVTGVPRTMGVGAVIAGNDGSYTWSSSTETTDQTRSTTVTMSTAEGVIPISGPVSDGATHTNPNRQAIVGAVLNPD